MNKGKKFSTMHNINFEFKISGDNEVSDALNTEFGIRQFTDELVGPYQAKLYNVNY